MAKGRIGRRIGYEENNRQGGSPGMYEACVVVAVGRGKERERDPHG